LIEVDVVYTWVNGNDDNWINKQNKFANEIIDNVSHNSCCAERYEDNDELRFSIRSLDKYASWIRNIYIVTDQQVPSWIKSFHNIKIIDHKDIFPDKDYLPTFNSMAIECYLQNIDGLSERFIYFNDDIFLGDYCSYNDFFLESGLPKIFINKKNFKKINYALFDHSNLPLKYYNEHQCSIINSRKLIHEKFNCLGEYTFCHGPKPMLKSVMNYLYEIFRKELDETGKTKFRDKDNILSSALHNFYVSSINRETIINVNSIRNRFHDLFIKFFNKNALRYKYISCGSLNYKNHLKLIKNVRPHVFCINSGVDNCEGAGENIRIFLNNYFPNKSRYE